MKDYSNVKFIKITDNNNPADFYIDVSIMHDTRLRISAIKGQYKRYLETNELYRPVFDLLNKDYSFCCLERGNFKSLDDVKNRRREIIEEQRERYKNSTKYIPSTTVIFK